MKTVTSSSFKTEDMAQCFICNQWQSQKYMRLKGFNSIEELVCIKCYRELRLREQQLAALQAEMEFEEEALNEALESSQDE